MLKSHIIRPNQVNFKKNQSNTLEKYIEDCQILSLPDLDQSLHIFLFIADMVVIFLKKQDVAVKWSHLKRVDKETSSKPK